MILAFAGLTRSCRPQGAHRPPPTSRRISIAFSLGTTTAIPDLSDGTIRTARIAYTPGTLNVFVDDLSTPVLSVNVDLATMLSLDNGQAYVGFTASSSHASENHDILSWRFVPEPACAGACLSYILLLRRREYRRCTARSPASASLTTGLSLGLGPTADLRDAT